MESALESVKALDVVKSESHVCHGMKLSSPRRLIWSKCLPIAVLQFLLEKLYGANGLSSGMNGVKQL